MTHTATIFDDLGVTPIINAAGTNTRLGGALMPPEVVDAMAKAAGESVSMEALQAAASGIIAEVTGAEAGLVTSGAAAALTLATAACLTRLDIAKMERLPRTRGMANRVIIAREQRCGYDHAIRAAGARLVEVGMNEVAGGAGVRATEAWEYEAAMSDKTVAIAYFSSAGSSPRLEEVVAVARRANVPLIVDAAAQLPPVTNLRSIIAAGADLVCFSGGKAIRGPQNTGILCGRRELIAAAALQHLDLDERWDLWAPPGSLIPNSAIPALPRHGIGRGFKVSKEAIVGLLTALRRFTPSAVEETRARLHELLLTVQQGLAGVPNVQVGVTEPHGPAGYPVAHLRIDEAMGVSALEVVHRLRYDGNPPIYLDIGQLSHGILTVNPINLTPERATILIGRLRDALSPSQHHLSTEAHAVGMDDKYKRRIRKLEDVTVEDWEVSRRLQPSVARRPSDFALELLKAMEGKDPISDAMGMVDTYTHSLQVATRAFRDGADEETVVVGLLHDIFDLTAPFNHDAMAAEFLRPYVSEENYWTVKHHGTFQQFYMQSDPLIDANAREQFRGHPAFDRTVEFCERWDQISFDPDYEALPLGFFEPMVHRVFARRHSA